MATAIVLMNDARGDFSKAILELPDGCQVSVSYNGTLADLKAKAIALNGARTSYTTARETIAVGALVDLTPPAAPPPPPPPTQTELDRQAFAAAWKIYCRWDNAVSAKLVPPTHQSYVDAQADLLAKWQPSFIDIVDAK